MSSRRATAVTSSRRYGDQAQLPIFAKDETEETPLNNLSSTSSPTKSSIAPSSVSQQHEPLSYYTQYDDLDYRQRKSRIFKMSASIGISLTLILAALLLVGSVIGITTYLIFSKNNKPAVQQPGVYFAVVGDYGRQGKENQQEVGNAMAKWCANQVATDNEGKCNFLISTGDNFYDNGVVNAYDPLFKLSYEDVYNADSMRGLTFYQILGNHDYRGNPEAELDYQAVSYQKNFVAANGPVTPYWFMPNYFYTAVEESKVPTSPSVTSAAQKRVRILFIFADTNPFIKGYYQDPKMNQTALQARSNIQEQLQLLKQQVAQFDKEQQDKADQDQVKTYKILIGHHPIASGSDKHEDKDEMAEYFVPLMKEIGANVYFNGHSHHLEYMRNETLHYFISGAGSRITGVKPHPLSKYQVSTPGFLFVRAFSDYIQIHFVNSMGEEIHTVKLTNV